MPGFYQVSRLASGLRIPVMTIMKRLVAVLVAITIPMPALAQSTPGVRPQRIRITPVHGRRTIGLALSTTQDALVFLPENGMARATIPFSDIRKIEVGSLGRFSSVADTAGLNTGLLIFAAAGTTVFLGCREAECGSSAGGYFVGILAVAIASGLGVRYWLKGPAWKTIDLWQLQSRIP